MFNDSGFMSSDIWSSNTATGFPDPFMDMASLAMPQTMQYALKWSEYIACSNGEYMQAINRTLSYFITEIELSEIEDDKEKQDMLDYLHNPAGIDILDDVQTAGMNYMIYGNDFSSMIIPFRRYLSCKQCWLELPLKNVYSIPDFKFKWTSDCKFHAHCPRCDYTGEWKHTDRTDSDANKIRMKHWSPHEIEILWNPYSNATDVIWKIPDEFRKMIKTGKLFHLDNVPWEIVECVRDNTHMRFNKDCVYHMKEITPAGIKNRGWGISRILSNFRQAWYVQVLRRYNEAIALDYVIPFRLITPSPGPGSADSARDALLNLNMGGYMSQIQQMLRVRRRDPAAWHTLPFPVQYQALGGDATQLAPRDLLDQGLEILLNNIGVPIELYKGTLQLQSAPTALRLFEASWSHLLHNLNGYLAFVMRRLCQMMNWQRATAKLRKVTHADDIQRQMAKLQVGMGGQTSKQTMLGTIGLDYFDETKRQIQEQKFEAEQSDKLQEDLEKSTQMGQMSMSPQQQQQGGMAPAGAPMGGMGGMAQGSANAIAGQPTIPNKPQTPEEMMSKAQQLAANILAMPESQKDSELQMLARTDKMMHALVTQQIEQMRRQAKNIGGQQVLAQQFGKQGSYGPTNTLPRFKSVLD